MSDQQKIYFLVCPRILVISWCEPGDEKGCESPPDTGDSHDDDPKSSRKHKITHLSQ